MPGFLATFSIVLFVGNGLFAQRICNSEVNSKYVRFGNVRTAENDKDFDQVIYVPVVVHIVYSSNNQNISDDQVLSQLKVLNEDFRRTNSDAQLTRSEFQGVATDSKINFFLASTDVFGLSTSGITRTSSNHGPFSNDDIHHTNLGGEDAWDTDRFLNIWICNLADGVFGYGTPPGTENNIDGIVIDYKYFGTLGAVKIPFHLGRTATHEVGHWLGLNHLWGIKGGCDDDDGIEDTPSQEGPISGCDLNKFSCESLNMVQNFMNTSVDACMNLFTVGQKKRMRENLFDYRAGLINEVISSIEVTKDPLKPYLTSVVKNEILIMSSAPIISTRIFDLTGKSISYSTEQESHEKYRLIINEDAASLYIVLVGIKDQLFLFKVLMN